MGAVGVHGARHFDHRFRRQPGHCGTVANIEDHGAALVARDGAHDGQGDAFVASALDVGGVTGLLLRPALLHVCRIALLPHPAPFAQGGSGADPDRVIERPLLAKQELAARLRATPDRCDRVAGEVVVVEVLVGQATQQLDPLGPEEPALLDRGQQLGVADEVRQRVAAVVVKTAQPPQVVEADVVEGGAIEVKTQRSGSPATQADRCVTDPQNPITQHLLHRLGDHPGGVGEVDDPSLWAELSDPLRDMYGDRDGPHPVGEATRAGGLLPEEALVEGDAFIRGASLEAAHADGREQEVCSVEGLVEVSCGLNGRRTLMAVRHLTGHLADRLQAIRRHVIQRNDINSRTAQVAQHRSVDEGDAETATSQDRELHVLNTSTPRPIRMPRSLRWSRMSPTVASHLWRTRCTTRWPACALQRALSSTCSSAGPSSWTSSSPEWRPCPPAAQRSGPKAWAQAREESPTSRSPRADSACERPWPRPSATTPTSAGKPSPSRSTWT